MSSKAKNTINSSKSLSKEKQTAKRVWYRIGCSCFDHHYLDQSVSRLLKGFLECGYDVIGPVPMPTKRKITTVLRDPFVHKRMRTQFALSLSKRILDVSVNENIIDPKSIVSILNSSDIHKAVNIAIREIKS